MNLCQQRKRKKTFKTSFAEMYYPLQLRCTSICLYLSRKKNRITPTTQTKEPSRIKLKSDQLSKVDEAFEVQKITKNVNSMSTEMLWFVI